MRTDIVKVPFETPFIDKKYILTNNKEQQSYLSHGWGTVSDASFPKADVFQGINPFLITYVKKKLSKKGI